MAWLATSVEVDIVHDAVTEVLLYGEVSDHVRDVAPSGAVVSIAIAVEQDETVAFPAVSVLVTV